MHAYAILAGNLIFLVLTLFVLLVMYSIGRAGGPREDEEPLKHRSFRDPEREEEAGERKLTENLRAPDSLKSRVYEYLKEMDGKISPSKAIQDLNVSEDELKSAIKELEEDGRIEKE